ncbi:hypothetical protein HPB50_015922 [Hyalomma asiaticum]|uniref:Uncharacterized protein n=1 Tax=Hyalomma asiaticum TaxID=266040 RepID=A0ACB7RWQ7_HYAAI|nr:hypothetical protein HPB50_015922 [Hyalomma asiaticum]
MPAVGSVAGGTARAGREAQQRTAPGVGALYRSALATSRGRRKSSSMRNCFRGLQCAVDDDADAAAAEGKSLTGAAIWI